MTGNDFFSLFGSKHELRFLAFAAKSKVSNDKLVSKSKFPMRHHFLKVIAYQSLILVTNFTLTE